MFLDYSVSELMGNDFGRELEGFLLALKNMSYTGELSTDKAKEILSKINLQNRHIYVAKTHGGDIIGTITLLVEQKFIHEGGKVGQLEKSIQVKG